MSNKQQDVLKSISKYSLSGNSASEGSSDFYQVQSFIADETGINLAIDHAIYQELKESKGQGHSKSAGGKSQKTKNWNNDDIAKFAAMYSSEVEEIRKDSSFTGSTTEIEYLRDILSRSSQSM